MRVRFRQLSRSFHLWGALLIFVPIVVVIGSGLLLQVKKQVEWIQPATQKGKHTTPTLSFEAVLAITAKVPEAEVSSWQDIDRLDVRPNKGIIKVLGKNKVEIQIDSQTGEVLQTAYRRSDTIEAIHDGSWFFENAKLWIFLPVGIVLLFLWLSGLILLYTTMTSRFRRKKARQGQVSESKTKKHMQD